MIEKRKRSVQGFTLLEVLLVLAIASSLIILMLNYTTQKADEMRRDKTVLQMQQVLNAGMSFYMNNMYWPLKGASAASPTCGTATDISVLQPNYLPATFNTPYGSTYTIDCDSTSGVFYVKTTVGGTSPNTNATIIASRLPTGTATAALVTASVNIPGQNLNNARSINFAGIYSSGACVPAPICPSGMKPSIYVAPVAVKGAVGASTDTYPITSFIATAIGPPDTDDMIPGCGGGTPGCSTSDPMGTKYWRVCLSVGTEKGPANQVLEMGSLLAVTRCVPSPDYPSGTPLGISFP